MMIMKCAKVITFVRRYTYDLVSQNQPKNSILDNNCCPIVATIHHCLAATNGCLDTPPPTPGKHHMLARGLIHYQSVVLKVDKWLASCGRSDENTTMRRIVAIFVDVMIIAAARTPGHDVPGHNGISRG
jgi:hypothetical protein